MTVCTRKELPKVKKEKTWVVRDYIPGDEGKIIELFEDVFGKPMGPTESSQHWVWEFKDNLVKPIFIKLVWDKERLVGQYAVSPLKVVIGGREYIASLSKDTMVDPDYRGQGIFSVAASALYEQLAENDFVFVYGFPNANSIGGFIKRLGWKIVMPTPVYIRPVGISRYIENKTKSNFAGRLAGVLVSLILKLQEIIKSRKTRGVDIRSEETFGDWADLLWNKCRHQHMIWAVRDKQYLKWRYTCRPETTYRIFSAWQKEDIAGYVVIAEQVRQEGNVCFIMDLLADVEINDTVDVLIETIETYANENNISFISAMVTPNCRYRTSFLKHLFIPLPQRLFPQGLHFGCRRFSEKLSPEILQDPNSWYISWGDVDVL